MNAYANRFFYVYFSVCVYIDMHTAYASYVPAHVNSAGVFPSEAGLWGHPGTRPSAATKGLHGGCGSKVLMVEHDR